MLKDRAHQVRIVECEKPLPLLIEVSSLVGLSYIHLLYSTSLEGEKTA